MATPFPSSLTLYVSLSFLLPSFLKSILSTNFPQFHLIPLVNIPHLFLTTLTWVLFASFLPLIISIPLFIILNLLLLIRPPATIFSLLFTTVSSHFPFHSLLYTSFLFQYSPSLTSHSLLSTIFFLSILFTSYYQISQIHCIPLSLNSHSLQFNVRARIFKCLWGPGIDSKK